MGETINISELAGEISRDIFKPFHWKVHPKKDENFVCVREDNHFPQVSDESKAKGKKAKLNKKQEDVPARKTHPTDVAFHYIDPYTGRRVYFLSDLKSYAEKTLKSGAKIRSALWSLCKSIDCADASSEWTSRYVNEDESWEVRGLLFAYNHDGKYLGKFEQYLSTTNLSELPLPTGRIVHVLDPRRIANLLSIVADMGVLQINKELGLQHTFVYPDLVEFKRSGDPWEQPATIEALCGPYMILKHRNSESEGTLGYVIYYTGPGKSFSEFIYLIDTLSRFQMFLDKAPIRIRMVSPEAGADYQANLLTAKNRYIVGWSMDEYRKQELELISIGAVKAAVPSYSALDTGWR